MVSLLCVAGLDPSGGAGISADIRACDFLRVHCCPVVTAVTAQNDNEFLDLETVSSDILNAQLDAVIDRYDIKAIKIGLAHSPEIIELLSRRLTSLDLPVIVDPVMFSSSGGNLVIPGFNETMISSLLPITTLITPNIKEAEGLTGSSINDRESVRKACLAIHNMGSKMVLIKGGHLNTTEATDILFDGSEYHEVSGPRIEGQYRGTGCTYSTLIAGYLGLGVGMVDAVSRSRQDLQRAIEFTHYGPEGQGLRFYPTLKDQEKETWLFLQKAVSELTGTLPPSIVPEVGINIAYALPGAISTDMVCALDSRIIKKGHRTATLGTPTFGQDSHVAKIVLAVMKHDREFRSCMNIRYDKTTIERLGASELTISSFSRLDEPEDGDTMTWGTDAAIRKRGSVPDVIYDEGDVGKEPMIRVLGRTPADVINKVKIIVRYLE